MKRMRTPTLWRAFASYGIWAVCFTTLYVVHALGCTWMGAAGGDPGKGAGSDVGLVWLLALIWALFVGWLILLTVQSTFRTRAVMNGSPTGRGGRFMVVLTLITDASAVVITVVSGLPIVLTPVCV